MAKTEAQSSVRERLVEYLRLEARFDKLNGTRRWSAKAMKREAFRHFPEQRLRQLHEEIVRAPDPGCLPRLVAHIKKHIIASANYIGFVTPSKAGHILVLFPGLADVAPHDLSRFGTSLAETYAIAVLEASEDPSMADCFGTNDDPARTDAEMADLKTKLDTLKESFRRTFGADDVGYNDVVVGGRRLAVAYYRVTGGEVELGAGPDSLINWGREHRNQLGV